MAKEELKLCRFELDGKPMVDMRYWVDTRHGPRPTEKGIVIEQKQVTRLVAALWSMHDSFSHEESRKKAGVEG